MEIVYFLAWATLWAVIGAAVGDARGRTGLGIALCLLLGPMGLVVLLVLPNEREAQRRRDAEFLEDLPPLAETPAQMRERVDRELAEAVYREKRLRELRGEK